MGEIVGPGMNEFEYLEYEYYDAQARWQTVEREGRASIREQLIQLSRRADLEDSSAGLRLADAMRRLAATIDEHSLDEHLRRVRRFSGVSEDLHVSYEHIRRQWPPGE